MERVTEVVKVKNRKQTKYEPATLLRAWKRYKKAQDEYTENELSAGVIVKVPRPQVYTENSFISHLNISRKTWSQYKEKKSFVHITEQILHEIEDRKEFFYLNNRGSTRALERDLKLHYGWVDPVPVPGGLNQLNLSALTDDELQRAIEYQQKLLGNGST